MLLLQTDTISSEQYFNLLGELDYWRRPERLNQWLMLNRVTAGHTPTTSTASGRYCGNRHGSGIIATGVYGPELGEALTRRRRQVFIEQLER